MNSVLAMAVYRARVARHVPCRVAAVINEPQTGTQPPSAPPSAATTQANAPPVETEAGIPVEAPADPSAEATDNVAATEPSVSIPRIIRVSNIINAVAAHYSTPRDYLLSPTRLAAPVRQRQVAMYLAKQMTLQSLLAIGRALSRRDHTTVLHGIRKIERLRATDEKLNADIAAIEERLCASRSQFAISGAR